MTGSTGLKREFTPAGEALPDTDFVRYLQDRFKDESTTRAVLDVFKKLNLPAPQRDREFLPGLDGALVFLNPYGVVVRIETADSKSKFFSRIDSPFIIQPLASIKAVKATIEICPGCFLIKKNDEAINTYLREQLRRRKINFWDDETKNIGTLPEIPEFPGRKFHLVIDRNAVKDLAEKISGVRRLLGLLNRQKKPKEDQEAEEVHKKLYGPFQKAFNNAWPDRSGSPDAEKMKKFWELCARKQGKTLIAGWNDGDGALSAGLASRAAKFYEESRLKSADRIVNSDASIDLRPGLR
ncbi:MAG: hypothetical protein V1721_02140 [Pseudomonadota bacterium]